MAERGPKTAAMARGALFGVVLAASGLSSCGSGGDASAGNVASTTAGDTHAAPVLTYYLDQTFTALGERPSPKTLYLGLLKMCTDSKLPTTPLSPVEVEKLATERRRVWQRPHERVDQKDTWHPMLLQTTSSGPCLFNGIKEESIREIRVLPQTLYVINLTKGTVSVQTQAGPPTGPVPPISIAYLKAFEMHEAKTGFRAKVGNSHALGQPCAVWKGYKPDHSLWYTECAWTGGLKNGIWPLSLLLWRKPATTGIGDKRAITTNAFLVGHLPPGSDAVFKLPAKAKLAGGASATGVKP